MRIISACLLGLLVVLAGCGGNATSARSGPKTLTTATPAPPSTPTAAPPTLPTTTATPPTLPGLSPLAPTPTTPTAPPTTPTTPTMTGTTTATTVGGNWAVSLTTTTGTPSLAFTVGLQQAASGAITGTALVFTHASACFGANTTITGQVSGTTATLTLSSALANGSNNLLQIQLTQTAANVFSGTYFVQPASGNTACGFETGTATMVRL